MAGCNLDYWQLIEESSLRSRWFALVGIPLGHVDHSKPVFNMHETLPSIAPGTGGDAGISAAFN
jgi:hypothetical protein